ncbi:hypothetical protein HPO96_05890 [Kribbella sandramycini]|uniref:3-hydroxyisobutyrate dehydrogenase-like beta-hydroxyacid dehydrogenase n=1 Tax=Kribbella sandramycini TaxID=60450 RepID=A0A7Y4NZ32_9ACTN|nr:hypothetical protein [Kribbella sandramycini]MBB6567627.1 3-hydroxyisobutyrate dehydrogenase-like beta-hydroxyacid dehydrogenase [Kribbella sandramycini]NOL39770.1 hypothetical protein [Kribbella sandramycini]
MLLALGRAGGLDAGALQGWLAASPATSEFVRDVVPAYLGGDRMATFGLDRIVEELDSLTAFARAHGVPAGMAEVTAGVHAAALAAFGAVDGELLGMEYLAGGSPFSPVRPVEES